MKIGVIGAGNVGTALARRLVPKGHAVMLSYSRDEAGLARTAAALGATSGTPAEAAAFGQVVALAVPWQAVPDALAAAGPLRDKPLWDCTNALLPDLSGMAVGTTISGGEEVARLAPGARVVKGIPPFAELMHADDPTIDGAPPGVFVAGDDAEAKAAVASLLADLPAAAVDAGGLVASRLIEPAMLLLVQLAYKQGMGPRLALGVIRPRGGSMRPPSAAA